jgi:formylglycine-generating enzyme required for sulfatase activity
LVAGALVLAGGAWWLLRSGSAPDVITVNAPTEGPTGASAPSASSVGPTTTPFGYTLAPVPAGTYTIGSPPTESGRSEDEAQHSVTLTRSFLMGTTEVTQGQYAALMGTNPVVSQSDCTRSTPETPPDDAPVYCVSWVDAAHLANAASAREGLESCYQVTGETVTWPKGPACTGYRLPTESEWEVAARGGGRGIYAGGNDLGGLGWFAGNSGGRTHPVGQMSPNGHGLDDMSGNVWEWTWDTYGDYPTGSVADPTGATEGPLRVLRGGSWLNTAGLARAAYRGRLYPGNRLDNLGLRLSRTIP